MADTTDVNVDSIIERLLEGNYKKKGLFLYSVNTGLK